MQTTTIEVVGKLAKKLNISYVWNRILSSYAMNTNELKSITRQGVQIFQVVGTPRSGTTLLASRLDNHPDIICLIEPYLSWQKKGYFDVEYKTNSTFESYRCKKPPHNYFRQLSENKTVKFVGFKETFRSEKHPTFPTRPFILGNVREKGVDATIAIIRDPRDVWASVINRDGYSWANTPIEEVIPDWNICAKWILDEAVFCVRYEDIVLQPQQTFRLIGDYLGIDLELNKLTGSRKKKGFGDIVAMQGGKITNYSIGRYQKDLPLETIKYIENYCGDFMTKFTYTIE